MKKEIVFLIILILGLLLGFRFIYSAIIYLPKDANLPPCDKKECGSFPPFDVCINTYAVGVGACGFSGCPSGQGQSELWSKYTITNECVLTGEGGNCAWKSFKTENWASIADKLEPYCPNCGPRKNGYLAPGYCDPNESGPFYKVCCLPNGTVGSSGPYAIQDAYRPPTEGVCTSGSPKIVASGLDTTPNSGDPHPACGGVARITCSSRKIDQDTAQFTANSSQGGTIEISVEGNVIERCTNTRTCTAEYTGSGEVQATASLIGSSGQTLVSVNCPPVTLGGGAPPPPPPPPASSQGLGGICSPVIVNRISYPNNPNQWSPEGQISQLNSQLENSNLVKKGDTLYLDVKLENRGTTATAQCKYIECTSQVQKDCCLRWEEVRTPCCVEENQETGECITWGTCPTLQCVEWGVYNECSGWSGEQTETISNPAVCRMSDNGVTIAFGFDILKKFFESTLNIANTFNVNPNSTINNGSVTLFALDQWASSLGWNGYVNPQRHGYFYLKSEKTGGRIYNQPDVITRSDGSFSSGCVLSNPPSVIGARNYIACQECRWTGSGWSCPWSGDKGSYTIFDETTAPDGRVNGTTPLNVEPGRIEFYTQPSNVAPYLSVEKSQAPTPSGVKTPLRDWIAGFPFKVNYGVNILGPGSFGNDKGNFWLELSGVLNFSGGTTPVSDSSTRNTLTFTPRKAGNLTITAKHNADDEKVSINENNEAIGDVESTSQTITIYRYLCYQGFCWECPNEPKQSGVILKVKEAGCQAVEDVKCQTYIRQSCKAGVRE